MLVRGDNALKPIVATYVPCIGWGKLLIEPVEPYASKAGPEEPLAVVDHELAVILDRSRDALMTIPGVVGVGLGQIAGEPVIQLFVTPSIDKNHVRHQAISVVADAPIAVVGMLTPNALNNA